MKAATGALACLVLLGAPLLSACDDGTLDDFEERLAATYAGKPEGTSRAYALKKSGPATSWLATIHGYPDKGAVCEELIAPYNNDPEMSAMPGEYFCEPLDG